MNIVWMCLTTIFSCVYVSYHHAVPETLPQIQSNIPWYEFYKNLYMKARWFLSEKGIPLLYALAAPELTLLRASRQRYYCEIGKQIMHNLCFGEWTISHSFLVRMKGFKIESGDVFNMDYSFYEWVLYSCENSKGFKLNIEKITEHIIYRNKSDALAKTVAALQVIWVLVQTVVRYIESLPISQLEIVTCAYVVCCVPVHYLWMHKPYNVYGHYALRNHEETCSQLRKVEKHEKICDLIKMLKPSDKISIFGDTSTLIYIYCIFTG